jgi:hypothetical protein
MADIVKIQTPLHPPNAPCLVYTRTRTFLALLNPSQLGEQVLAKIAGRDKAFFQAEMRGGKLELGDEVPDPGW